MVIVDANLRASNGQTLIAELRGAHGAHLPLIALCDNDVDVLAARAAQATDIARRPFDWDIIARRAANAVCAGNLLDELKDARQRLRHMRSSEQAAARARSRANGIDRQTRLPNAERFRSLVHKATASRTGKSQQLAVIVIGLDNLRLINDAIGYENGNRLLGLFADRLRDCLVDRDVVGGDRCGTLTAIAGRLGGARFALLVSNGSYGQIIRAQEALSARLAEPFEVGGQSVYLTASFGAAIYPDDCTNADALLYCADSAMREAQETGSGFEFYSQPMQTSSREYVRLDRMLREALRNNELELAFQPINDTGTGKVVAAEALLRWNHETEGQISPAIFVPVAEQSGLMCDIGTFVIRAACAQLRRWLDSGMEPIRVAVNVSLCQLLRGDVAAIVASALQHNNLDPGLLELELSERGVLNQRAEVVGQVRRLKSLGVRISIDDFGTGQAAIGYLKDLPIDVIKIDRSYVSGSDQNERDSALASGMVALAEGLKATVVAEGVETAAQLDKLRQWGSHEYQGFLCSPAVSGDEFLAQFA